MARYDSQGYRNTIQGVRGNSRQIMGYSRQAQGGADQARARANQRLYESQDHLYSDGRSIREARQRAQRVSKAKAEGSFDETRDTYNEESRDAGVEMDKAGNIIQKPKAILASTTEFTPDKPVRDEPMSMARPMSQRLDDMGEEAGNMATAGGLAEMARKARVRRTKVARI